MIWLREDGTLGESYPRVRDCEFLDKSRVRVYRGGAQRGIEPPCLVSSVYRNSRRFGITRARFAFH